MIVFFLSSKLQKINKRMQKMWCKWKLNMQIDIYFIYFLNCQNKYTNHLMALALQG